ncbi:hypothetical protein FGG08_005630 [Glutinoglossum americanum]|uniref:Uncharacterized protein n=1 Tax=Glutinoglossum americanum TaxID=1670608 RepID=A0A9P8KYB9_9PEZI|nr:hypothetical protein FGG08_005630 [Glutinoglossum americanum]
MRYSSRKRRIKEANLETSEEGGSIHGATAKGLDEGDFFGTRSRNSAPALPPKQVHEQADTDQIGIARSVSRKVPTSVDPIRRPPNAKTNDLEDNISLSKSPCPPLSSPPRSPQSIPGNDAAQLSYPPTAFEGARVPPKPETPVTHDPSLSPPRFVFTTETPTTGLQQGTRLPAESSVSGTGPHRSSIVNVNECDVQRAVSPVSSPPHDRSVSPVSPSNFPAVPTNSRRDGNFYFPTPSPPPSRGSDDQPLLNPSQKGQGTESPRASVGEWTTGTFRAEQDLHSREGSIAASSVYSTDLTHRNRGERLSLAPVTSRPSSAGADAGLAPPGSQRQSSASLTPSGYSHSHLSSQFGDLYDAYYRQSRQSFQSKMDEADDHNAPAVESGASKNPRNLTLAEYTIVEVPSPLPSPMRPA